MTIGERLIAKKVGTVVLGIAVAILLFLVINGSFYTVSEQENAVVTQFGEVLRVDTAGLHFKIPLIQDVTMVDMTTHGIGIGYNVDANGQNITVNDDGIMITKDFNLLNIDFYLEYRVSDPIAFLYNSRDPEAALANTTLGCVRTVVLNYTVDEAMTTAKGQIQQDVRDLLLKSLSNYNIGLSLVNITVQDSEPPTAEIIAAFKAVETAKQGAETAKNEALQYQNERIPAAEATADRTVQNAEAYKAARIAEAEGQVARFNSMYEEFKKYPLITKKRLFYETIEGVLKDANVIITDGDTQTMLPLKPFSGIGE